VRSYEQFLKGRMRATACIVIPALNDDANLDTCKHLACWIDGNIDYYCLTFFKLDNAFNIGWHEKPKRKIYSFKPKSHWIKSNLVESPLLITL
jgi:hypothetical protein